MTGDDIDLTAIALIERVPQDADALDVLLPDMTGRELAAILGAVLWLFGLVTAEAPDLVASILGQHRTAVLAGQAG